MLPNQELQKLWGEIRRLEQEMRTLRMSTLQAKEVPMREIYAFYQSGAAQSIANNSWARIDFETKVFDTHAAVTTGASWKFTPPATTMYIVSCFVIFDATTAWALGEMGVLALYKNGVLNSYLDWDEEMDSSAGALNKVLSGTTPIYLKTNEYIEIQIYQNTGGPLNLTQTVDYTTVKIVGLQGI